MASRSAFGGGCILLLKKKPAGLLRGRRVL